MSEQEIIMRDAIEARLKELPEEWIKYYRWLVRYYEYRLTTAWAVCCMRFNRLDLLTTVSLVGRNE